MYGRQTWCEHGWQTWRNGAYGHVLREEEAVISAVRGKSLPLSTGSVTVERLSVPALSLVEMLSLEGKLV